MSHGTDILIVGAGLAGATAAFTLSRQHNVHVVEADAPGSGASGAAAGLVNPFMGRRARPVRRLREALAACSRLLERAGASELFPQRGVLRPVVEEDQEASFREAAREHPSLAAWVPPREARDRFPGVQTGKGALWIPQAGAINVRKMVGALLEAAEANGAVVETQAPVLYWRETPSAAVVEVERGHETEDLQADRAILALGQGYPPFPELRRLGLTGVKGQTVRVERPSSLNGSLPPLSGRGYVVPDGDTLVLGSNYDNDFDDLTPDPDATEYIREKTSRMVPALADATVVDEVAGVRVKQKGSNQPVLGPLPDRTRIWVFTALGSKGLLTAPLLAQSLPHYLDDPSHIPEFLAPDA